MPPTRRPTALSRRSSPRPRSRRGRGAEEVLAEEEIDLEEIEGLAGAEPEAQSGLAET